MVKGLILDILKNKRTNQFSIVLPKKKMLKKRKNSDFISPKKIKLKDWEFEF